MHFITLLFWKIWLTHGSLFLTMTTPFGESEKVQRSNSCWKRLFHHVVITHVDLMVMHLSCSSLRVSVKRVSPALAPAMIPAFETRESVSVDLPWSTCAMTDMLRMFRFLSIMARISSTVKFTCTNQKTLRQHFTHHNTDGRPLVIPTFHT